MLMIFAFDLYTNYNVTNNEKSLQYLSHPFNTPCRYNMTSQET